MPCRRWLAATIIPRSATCALAGWGSRASERRPTIWSSSSSDEDRCVGVATHGLQVPALVGDRPPRLGRQEPARRLAADRGRKGDEGRRVRRLGGPDRDHGDHDPVAAATRVAGGAERRRPAGARRQRRRRRRGCGRPSVGRRSRPPRARSRRRRASRPRRGAVSPSTWSRGRAIASATGKPCPTTASTTWRIAPARRTEPALPATSRGLPSSSRTSGRRHHARQPRAGLARLDRRSRRARRACC